MTGSDRHAAPLDPPRPELAALIRAQARPIMQRWERAARRTLTGASSAPRLVLIDFLRESLARIADDIDGAQEGSTSEREAVAAAIHGSERAAVPRYDTAQVAQEYRLLKRILIEVLGEQTELTAADVFVLGDYVDQAIVDAVQGFAEAMQEAQVSQARGLVHDLLNPLSTIRLQWELIHRTAPEGDAIRRYARQGLRATRRIETMARNLLDTARLQAGEAMRMQFQQADLRGLVQEVCESARMLYGERLRVQCPKGPIEGCFAAAGVARVLENLITNAARHGDPEAPITVTLTQGRKHARLAVHNWGEPIPPQQRRRLFQEFYRLGGNNQESHSWGIGLNVVRMVAEAHGGSVRVASDAERGTTFTVTLCKDPPHRPSVVTASEDPAI